MSNEIKELDGTYAGMAREMADALMRFARERRDEDKKQIAWMQYELCALRRKENNDDQPSPDSGQA